MVKNAGWCSCELRGGARHFVQDPHAHRVERLNNQIQMNELSNGLVAMTISDRPTGSSSAVNSPTTAKPVDHSVEMAQTVSDSLQAMASKFRNRQNATVKTVLMELKSLEHHVEEISQTFSVWIRDETLSRDGLEMAERELVESAQFLLRIVNKHRDVVPKKDALNKRISELRKRIPVLLHECDAEMADELTDPKEYDSRYIYRVRHRALRLDPITQIVCLLGLIAHTFTKTSIAFCNLLFTTVTLVIKLTMSLDNSLAGTERRSQTQEDIVNELPKSLNQALKYFSLEGKTILHAVCPNCRAVYPPTVDPISGDDTWPMECEAIVEDHLCGCDLLVERSRRFHPLVPYLVPCLFDHLARMLSDPVAEEVCKRVVDDAFTHIGQQGDLLSSSHNIFTSSFLREFKDKNGHLFLDRKDLIRLLLALHYDQFNPQGGRNRSDSSSVGIITIVNLIFEPDTRYLPEHLYFALIPGPFAPTGPILNNFLAPIIDMLVLLYDRGLHLLRTAMEPEGATVEAAVVLVIADLIAARHMTGLPGATANWICSYCNLYGRREVFRVDDENWVPRDCQHMRSTAEAYHAATSPLEQKRIWDEHGIKWSELYRLPYFDPTKMLAPGPMHCLLEGAVHFQSRHVLRIVDIANDNKKTSIAYDFDWEEYDPDDCDPGYEIPVKDQEVVRSIHRLLQRPIDESHTLAALKDNLTNNKSLSSLKFVVHSLGLTETISRGKEIHLKRMPATSRAHFAEILTAWREEQPFVAPSRPPAPPGIPTNPIVVHVQHVVKSTVRPGSMNKVPHNFGQASAGTVKADEWRTMATVLLPIALVTLLGDHNGQPPPPDDPQLPVLRHAMALFQAVTIAMRYTITPELVTKYRELIKEWIEGFTTVHPAVKTQKRTRTNIHLVYHIFTFLELFGPVTSWWEFPFERLIGVLQGVTSNGTVGGEMESTTTKSYMKSGNLRRWLKLPECPEPIAQLRNILDKIYQLNGPLLDEYSEADPKDEQEDKAWFTVKSKIDKVTYARSSTHMGDSVVIYFPSPQSATSVAGQIDRIDIREGKATFTIKRHASLPSYLHDPFKYYPYILATTYLDSFSHVDIVGVDAILGHGARFGFSHDRVVVLNLSRM